MVNGQQARYTITLFYRTRDAFIAVAKVAHSEHLKGILPSAVVDKELRSDASRTMALIGLIAGEAVIATRVGGK